MDQPAPRAGGLRWRCLLTLSGPGSQQAPRPLVSLGEGGSKASERGSKVLKRVLATLMTILAPWMHVDRARWAGGGGCLLTLSGPGSQQAPRPLVSLDEGGSEGSERGSKVLKRVLATLMTIPAPWINLHHARWAGGGDVFSL